MFELDETQRMVESAARSWSENELAPALPELESGEILPYELLRRLCADSRGAIRNQLIMNPPSVAGISHTAGRPQAKAAPLTPSRLQAEDELAEALSAATRGPSLRPPR